MEIPSSSPYKQLLQNFSHSIPLAMNNGIWGKVNNLALLNSKSLQVFDPAIILTSSWSFLMHARQGTLGVIGGNLEVSRAESFSKDSCYLACVVYGMLG